MNEHILEQYLRHITIDTKWQNKVFVAGGYVRDQLLGFIPKDFDIVIDAENGGIEFANWITKLLGIYKEGSNPVVYPTYGTAKFSLYGILYKGIDLSEYDIEAVMPRSEIYTPGSRNPEVEFSKMNDDAYRRDLTINSLFKNISSGEIYDYTGVGISDLRNGILRTPLDPTITFTDDPLRMLRVVRFYSRFNYKLSLSLIRSLQKNAHRLCDISKERIADELNKMLLSENPHKAIKLLKITNLLYYVISEFRSAVGMTQNKYHDEDVFDHTLTVLSKTEPVLNQRLMALFHDIGKTVTRTVDDNGVHFYGHEYDGSIITEKVLRELRYSNDVIQSVVSGVRNHMKLKHGGDDATNLSDKSLRKFVVSVGDDLNDILNVIHADNISHHDDSNMFNQIDIVRDRISNLDCKVVNSKPDIPIDGNDLIALGLTPGPVFTELLQKVVDAWSDNPNITKEESLNIIKNNI